MVQFFISGGIFMWLLLLLFVLNIILVVRKSVDFYEGKSMETSGIHIIPFIGLLSLTLGMFGQILGIMQALKAIVLAADINPAIVEHGFRISFYPTIFGFIIFMLSLFAWIILYRWSRVATHLQHAT